MAFSSGEALNDGICSEPTFNHEADRFDSGGIERAMRMQRQHTQVRSLTATRCFSQSSVEAICAHNVAMKSSLVRTSNDIATGVRSMDQITRIEAMP
jgi:hypothetical protein